MLLNCSGCQRLVMLLLNCSAGLTMMESASRKIRVLYSELGSLVGLAIGSVVELVGVAC
jgi:hypothetical protein